MAVVIFQLTKKCHGINIGLPHTHTHTSRQLQSKRDEKLKCQKFKEEVRRETPKEREKERKEGGREGVERDGEGEGRVKKTLN